MIYVVSLPRIDTRYTVQWYDWVKTYAAENKRDDIVVMGDSKIYSVSPTEFLNYREYFNYVYPQIMDVLRVCEDGDRVFFMDGETAGLEAFEYVRKMEQVDIKIDMFWHAGTYDENDLPFIRGVKGMYFEMGWFDIADKIFVGSEYHKSVLGNTRGVPPEKIKVTGLPTDLAAFKDGTKVEKVRDFIFTGRKVAEKGYDIVKALKAEGVDITVSLDQGWKKDEFYEELAKSRMLINPSKHELFGIAMMEAFASNVPVIAPDLPTFRTVVPAKYRIPYEDFLDVGRFLEHSHRIMMIAGKERKVAEPYEFRRVMAQWFR